MIRTGTCSWTEKTLIDSGEFYPVTVKSPRERLMYYSSIFNTVEVDSSYYAIPAARTVSLWTDRTPEYFTFHIKAYGALTGHGIDPRSLPKDIFHSLPDEDINKRYIYVKDSSLLKPIAQRFVDVLTPLGKEGKLGMLVFQYPPWFRYSASNLDYILTCKTLMSGLPVAVEFRHGSWLTPDRAEPVFNFLKKNRLTYITADEPQYGSLATIPFIPHVTTDTAYFRFHGRNKKNWLKKGISTSLRYDYFYKDDELRDFVPHIKKAGRQTKATFAMFNNCHGGFAVKDALRLRELMKNQEEME
jgi:uncharacterized protein YecE (DUF72 family)